jgi:hypothetical protein
MAKKINSIPGFSFGISYLIKGNTVKTIDELNQFIKVANGIRLGGINAGK